MQILAGSSEWENSPREREDRINAKRLEEREKK